MKKLLCVLMGLMLILICAHAEGSPAPTIEILLITPTPSPVPAKQVFSSEDLIVTLPLGMEILSGDELAGYNAALQADYPETARTVFAATGENGAALIFSIAPSDADAAAAAKEAASALSGSADSVFEIILGENSFAGFDHSLDGINYDLYFTVKNGQLLSIGASGIENSEIESMLTGLIF